MRKHRRPTSPAQPANADSVKDRGPVHEHSKRMRKRPLLTGGLTFALLLGCVPMVSAFTDIDNDPHAAAIRQLEQSGIVGGSGSGQFKPQEKLSYAEGVSLVVKAFEFNLDRLRFIREPLASQYFPGMNDKAWYASPFLAAAANGVQFPKDMSPGASVTREQFADLVAQGIHHSGDYAFTQQAVVFKDENAVAEPYRASVQMLLKLGIAKLDEGKEFKPKTAVTRSEAAAWINGGVTFVDKMNGDNGSVQNPAPSASPLQELALTASKLSDKVQEVKVTAQAPNPGYGLVIAGIEFSGTKAILSVEVVPPKPGQMNPQVMTEISAVTYIGSSYTPELRQTQDEGGIAARPFKGGILPGKNAR